MRNPTPLLLLALLCGCSQAPAVSTQLSDEQVRQELERRGWEVDHQAIERKQVHKKTGLSWPDATTQDEALSYGKQAWGLPPRLMGKVLRHEAKRNHTAIHPTLALVCMDGIGRAGEISQTEPDLLLKVYWDHHQKMEALGLTMEEGIALLAGIAHTRKQPHLLHRDASVALAALQDPKWQPHFEAHGIGSIQQGRNALALLSDMDRLQHQHEEGFARVAYLRSAWGEEWELLLDPNTRNTTCRLLGEMRCATGSTHQRLEERQQQTTVDDSAYLQATANLELLGRSIER